MSGWMDDVTRRLEREWQIPRIVLSPSEPGVVPRPAAVLVPLFVKERELWTFFTRRADTLEHHKGQISFPGGVREEADHSLWETAVRETEEEVGIPKGAVRFLGTLPSLVTVTDFEVSPFVAAVPYPMALALAPGEVDEVVEIPVSELLDPAVLEMRPLTWKGHEITTPVYRVRGVTVWGATAWILSNLLGALRSTPA